MSQGSQVILVVDSNDDAREVYCTFFSFKGYTCLPAATGEEALRLLHEHTPSLVLLEERLPGLDGWQVLKTIRHDPRLCAVRVILLTSDVFEAPRERAEHLGADGFATKPVLPSDLERLVRELLDGHAGTPH